MDRSSPFYGPDAESDVDRVTSPRHKKVVYSIYAGGMILATVLFFTITDMSDWANIILYILTLLLMAVNMWFSAEYIDDLNAEYRMFREVEQNASSMIPYIVTIAVLAVTLSRKDEYDYHFKYSILVSIICLIAVVLVVWLPENNKWMLRYMRDVKTVLFTIGAVFGISSVYSVIAKVPTTKNGARNGVRNGSDIDVPQVPTQIDADIMDDIGALDIVDGAA